MIFHPKNRPNPMKSLVTRQLVQPKDLLHFSILTTFRHLTKSLGLVRGFEIVLAKVIWRNAAKLSYFGKTRPKTPFPGLLIPSPADNHPSKVPKTQHLEPGSTWLSYNGNTDFGHLRGMVVSWGRYLVARERCFRTCFTKV